MNCDRSDKLTEDEMGNIVAKAVWRWLQDRKVVQFVPWVLNPQSDKYDPLKAARQNERDELLSELESCILEAVPKEVK